MFCTQISYVYIYYKKFKMYNWFKPFRKKQIKNIDKKYQCFNCFFYLETNLCDEFGLYFRHSCRSAV